MGSTHRSGPVFSSHSGVQATSYCSPLSETELQGAQDVPHIGGQYKTILQERGVILCPLSILSLARVILCVSDLLWKYVSEGEKLNLYFSLVIKVVSELLSGPWAAPGQPFLEELSRPKTLKFRSSYQTKVQR